MGPSRAMVKQYERVQSGGMVKVLERSVSSQAYGEVLAMKFLGIEKPCFPRGQMTTFSASLVN